MKNLSIVLKVWLVLGLAVISFTTVVAVSVFFTARNNITTQEMGDSMYETSKLASQVRTEFRAVDEFFTQAVTLSDPDLLATAQQNNTALTGNISRLIALNPASAGQLGSLRDDTARYAEISAAIAQDFIDGIVDFNTVQSDIETKTALFEQLSQQFTDFESRADTQFSVAIDALSDNMTFALVFMLVLGGVLLVLTISLGHYTANRISASARELGDSLAELASGKGSLASRLPVSGNDELGVVATQFNQFIAMLQTSFNDLTSIIEPLTASAHNLTKGMDRLDEMTEEQTSDSQIVTQSMSELQLSVRDISQSASNAARNAESGHDLSQIGQEKTSTVVAYSQKLSNEIRDTQRVISDLAVRTNDATEILKSINDIADQTNLLALNAAIEAARAGEQGRGFSVVADEVRSLSLKTANSVTMIQDVLKQLNDNVASAVGMMRVAVDVAEQSEALASDAGDSILKINNEIEQISLLNAQIAAATEQQSMATEQIVANTNKMASSFVEAKSIQVSVYDISDKLSSLSDSLVSVSSRFKT